MKLREGEQQRQKAQPGQRAGPQQVSGVLGTLTRHSG